jgi:hypothetical protein
MMDWVIALLCSCFLVGVDPTNEVGAELVKTRFEQVQPAPKDPTAFERSAGQKWAVVLIHGHRMRFRKDSVQEAAFHDWQRSGSTLVKALGSTADVFAFAYTQNVEVERIAQNSALKTNIKKLRALGYEQIVLMGHSAGGLIAREFVEDNSDAGVTRIIQVCTPNGGTPLADFGLVSKRQQVFVQSLTEAGRRNRLKQRSGKKIPAKVQCVCVVGCGHEGGDGVIAWDRQWTADLRAQGIPAVALPTLHNQPMRAPEKVKVLVRLVHQEFPRWSPDQVDAARKKILNVGEVP